MNRFLIEKKPGMRTLLAILLIGWLFSCSAKRVEGALLPGPGHVIGPFTLPVPQNAEDAAYLGLESGSRFQPTTLDVDLWVIEVVNVYCASCQVIRPIMNSLFSRIQAEKQLKDRVKMLAVGAGNHHWDIKGAEKDYDFPVVADTDYAFHERVGQPPTPFIIFARPLGQGRMVVVASHLGRIQDEDPLFALVRKGIDRNLEKMATRPFVAPGMAAGYPDALAVPLSELELVSKVSQSLTVDGNQAVKIEPLHLPGWDGIYTGKMEPTGKRVFASVVARKIPCIDCHDVFYVYSFDADGRFLRFVPISIYKIGNEAWNEEDVATIQTKLQNKSLWSAVPFSPDVDAVSGATISTELIYDSIGDTRLLFDVLVQKGYMTVGDRAEEE